MRAQRTALLRITHGSPLHREGKNPAAASPLSVRKITPPQYDARKERRRPDGAAASFCFQNVPR